MPPYPKPNIGWIFALLGLILTIIFVLPPIHMVEPVTAGLLILAFLAILL